MSRGRGDMVQIYDGEYLQMSLDEYLDGYVVYWKTSPTVLDFKSEMLRLLDFHEQYRAKYVLWLQQNFELKIDPDLQHWIEANINVPGKEFGTERVAFVVSKDLLAHLTVIETFENTDSVIAPRHFASEHEARRWLRGEEVPDNLDQIMTGNLEITIEEIKDKGENTLVRIRNSSGDIVETIKLFRNVLEEHRFVKGNLEKYSALTDREKEVLSQYCLGKKHKEIADTLYISTFTVQTHWRNVKQKLELRTFPDLLRFATAFDLVY